MSNMQKQIGEANRELIQALETRLELEIRKRRLQRLEAGETGEYGENNSAELPLQKRFIKIGFAENILRQLVVEADTLTDERRPLVAFQGARGAYSDVATRALITDGISIPNMSFGEVFQEVNKGYCDFGVVPVENSLEGAVTEVNDLLTKTDLKVIGEKILKIEHCLLVAPETELSEVRLAYSHPQALAQCREFLLQNNIEPRPFFDTAGAAQMISRNKPRAACAIGSALSGALYGLRIAREGIADNATNSTRFLLMSRVPYEGEGEKCSIIFATDHSAGALFNVLKLFADARINLTRIASMPRRDDPGNYDFFLDFEGSDGDETVVRVLEHVAERTVSFRFLGCYPKDSR